MALEEQMEMNFGKEVPENTVGVDPVSGNEIPLGSTAENVRDDIPANLSEGEIVVPADVVNFHGVKLFEDLREEAKRGYAQMAQDGRIGGEPMMEDSDTMANLDIDISVEDLQVMDDEEPVEMRRGGMNFERGRGSIYKSYPRSKPKSKPKPQKTSASTAQANRQAAAARSLAAHNAFMSKNKGSSSAAPVVQTTVSQPSSPSNKDTKSFPSTPTTDPKTNLQETIGSQINFPGFENTFVNSSSDEDRQQRARAKARADIAKARAKGNQLSFGQSLVKSAREGASGIYDFFTGNDDEPDTGMAASGSSGGGGGQPNTYSVYDGTQGKSFMEVISAPYRAIVGDDEEDMNEGGLVNPEPFYSQKGGFDLSHMENTGTVVQEYMNDEGHRIYITFVNGVPQMEIPEGYYPVGEAVSLNTVVNSSIPTMDGISPEPVRSEGSDMGDDPSAMAPAPDPVNYKELSIDELKSMVADQKSMGSKIFAGLSPLTKIIMWDQTRKTKGEIERRIEDPNTSEVDKMRLNNLLELMNREEPGLAKTLLDKVTGKEFERVVSQIPKPVVPDVDYSDPTLAPDQGIYTPDPQIESDKKIPNVDPELAEPYVPQVPTPFSDETIEASEKISKEAAEKSFSQPQPQPQSETERMLQQQRDAASEREQEARDRSRDIASVAQQTGSSIAQVGRDIAPSNETRNIDFADPRRGGAPSTPRRGGGGRNKGGLMKKKKKKSK